MKLVKGTSMYTLGVALFAALGTFLFVCSCDNRTMIDQQADEPTQGFDTGIVTTSENLYLTFTGSMLKLASNLAC